MQSLQFKGPFRGIRTYAPDQYLAPDEAEYALNINLATGSLKTRPGLLTKFGIGGDCLGIHDWIKPDGTVSQIVKIASGGGSGIQRLDNWVNTNINGGSTDMTNLCCFQTVNNKVYFCDGSFFKVTDGVDAFTAEIARPSAAPSAAATGAAGSGALKGTYDYVYTHYSSTWGQESYASDPCTPAVADSQDIAVSGNSANSDARIDRLRVYRRKVSAGESIWRFLVELPYNGLPWTIPLNDQIKDNDVSTVLVAPFSLSTSTPTNFRFMTYQSDVLFLSGMDTHPTRVYYSRAGQPWVADQFLDIGSGADTDPVTGLAAFQGLTVVFKTKSIWTISGNTKDSFNVTRVEPGVGCVGHFSIVEADDLLYFRSEKGWYVWGGGKPIDISEDIRDVAVDFNYARGKYCVGVHDYANSAIRWSYSSSAASSANDKTIVFFYGNTKRAGRTSWMPWSNNSGTTIHMLVTDSTTRQRLVASGQLDGRIFVDSGTTDNGSYIPAQWRTGRINGGLASRKKIWRELAIETVLQSGGSIRVEYWLDGASSAIDSTNFTMNVKEIMRAYVRHSSKDLRLFFTTINNPSIMEILGWTLDYEVAGRT